ncbi:MAG: hypothetical protein PHE66_10820 [Syntrophaceticus schinkii]|nr:hypothetical protein [Syntrophaceticus schinkii]
MKEQDLDFELPDQMSCQELIELQELFKEYSVPLPSEGMIEATINDLRQYVPEKKNTFELLCERIHHLVHHAASDLTFMNKGYWISSLVIFILGYLITVTVGHNPCNTILLLSPIPFIIGILEICRGREEKVLELELACKVSPQEMMLSRLVVIGLYSIVLNSALACAFSAVEPGMLIWRITLLWLTPLTVIGSLTLWLAGRIRGGYVVTAMLSLWVVLALAVLSMPGVTDQLINIHIGTYLVLLFLGFTTMLIQVQRIMSRGYFERSNIIETGN